MGTAMYSESQTTDAMYPGGVSSIIARIHAVTDMIPSVYVRATFEWTGPVVANSSIWWTTERHSGHRGFVLSNRDTQYKHSR
jgi:hypothetical protein